MLYATHSGLRTIVAAADDPTEFGGLDQEAHAWDPPLHVEVSRPGLVEMLGDPAFAGLRMRPHVFHHADEAQRAAFARERGITILAATFQLAASQKKMLGTVEADPFDPAETRSIAEIEGLDKHDPWDRRTDEEKAEDAAYRKKVDALSKGATPTGDSFAPPADADNGAGVHVSGITVASDGAGGFDVVGVSATKVVEADATLLDGLLVDPFGKASVFHKVSVAGQPLAAVSAILASASIDPRGLVVGGADVDDGCWLAVVRQSTAARIKFLLATEDISAEVSTVDNQGEPLAQAEASVAEAKAGDEHPRPWNARAGEIEALDEAGQEALRATMQGEEFVFAGDNGDGQGLCRVFVAPASYFKASGEMWPEPLGITALLPPEMSEVSAGYYVARTRDWLALAGALMKIGLSESMLLRLHLNNL